MKKKHKVFLARLGDSYENVIREGMEWTDLQQLLGPSTRVCIKPNLTFPTFRKGVMTNPGAVEGMIRYLKGFTNHITICESDSGGYNRFSMDEVFTKTGLRHCAKKYGVRIVNLSYEKSRAVEFQYHYKYFSVPLPTLLLEETDLFITMPVPKIHMNTTVSMSIKNQWGIIQDPSLRLKLHPHFKVVIYEINKALPRAVSIVDGKYGLTRSGPLRGDAVELNWLLVADNLFAADFVCCQLLGIDPFHVSYVKFALQKEGMKDFSDIILNCDYKQFITIERFYLKREWTDYPGLIAFNSRLVAYLGYHSPLAGFLHKLLYLFREPFYDHDRYRERRS